MDTGRIRVIGNTLGSVSCAYLFGWDVFGCSALGDLQRLRRVRLPISPYLCMIRVASQMVENTIRFCSPVNLSHGLNGAYFSSE